MKFLVFAITFIFIFSGVATKIAPYVINRIPLKVVSADGMSVSVNQNSEFTLPSKAKVTMNFGIIRTVDVKWNPEEIDTSAPGVKTSMGICSFCYQIKILKVILRK